jgi:very-short-patch-repair endonuclease
MRPLTPSRHRLAVLAARAHALREFATVSERRLWLGLSAGKAGASFRRQVVLGGRYVADFYAPALRLVVEVDGSVHQCTRCADARREERLRRLGYVVLRLDAELVMRDLPAAVARVREEVERLG